MSETVNQPLAAPELTEETAALLANFKQSTTAIENANKDCHLPLDGLPVKFREIVESIAKAHNVPTDVTLMSALTIAGAALGAHVTSQIGSHKNHACLWTMIVAKSSAGKTAPMRELMRPLQVIDNKMINEYRETLEAWKSQESKRKSDVEGTPKPKKKQIVCVKATGAARMELLANNERGVILFSDELRGFVKSLNNFGGTGEEEELLSIFSSEPIKSDTIGDEYIRQCNVPFMPILGGMQPGMLRNTFSKEHIISGFMNRFAVVQYERKRAAGIGQAVDPHICKQWDEIIESLRGLGNIVWNFNATADARKLYEQTYLRICDMSEQVELDRDDDYNEYKESALQKISYFVARIALITHVLKIVERAPRYPFEHPDIDIDTMRFACDCVPYFTTMQMKAYEFWAGATAKKPLSQKEVVLAVADLCRRKEKELNQSALADLIGANRSVVCDVINGKR